MSEISPEKTSKSTQEKEKLFLSLVDMFVDAVEPDIIQMVLQNRSWDLNSAVEDIMILSNNFPTKKSDDRLKPNSIKVNYISPSNGSLPRSENKAPNMKNPMVGINQVNKKFTTKQKIQDTTKFPISKISENKNRNCQTFLEQYNDIKSHSSAYERTLMLIREGVKLMVILRGPPGIGKSFLAKKILSESCDGIPNYKRHIFSSDDFFITNNIYYFVPEQLSEAHSWNQRNVSKAIKDQVSPIIVDNTNTQAWEMRVYADMAVSAGYDLEIVEPDRIGTIKESELARRTVHGVPKAKIRNMMDRYEKNLTPHLLLQQFQLKYSLPNLPPQPTRASKWKDKLSNHKNNKPKKKADEGLKRSTVESKYSNYVKNPNESLKFENFDSCPNLNLPPPSFPSEPDLNDHYLYFNGTSKQTQNSPSRSEKKYQTNLSDHSDKQNFEDTHSGILSATKLYDDKDSNEFLDFDGFLTKPIKKHDIKVNLRNGDFQGLPQVLESESRESKSRNEFNNYHFDWMAETNKLLSAIGASVSASQEAQRETSEKAFTPENSNYLENKNDVFHDIPDRKASFNRSKEVERNYEQHEPLSEESVTDLAGQVESKKLREIITYENKNTCWDYVLITDDSTYMYQRPSFQPLPERISQSNDTFSETMKLSDIEGGKIKESLTLIDTKKEDNCCLGNEMFSNPDYSFNGVETFSKSIEIEQKLSDTLTDSEARILKPKETQQVEVDNEHLVRIDGECKVLKDQSNQIKSKTDIEEVVEDIWSILVNNVEKSPVPNSPSNYFAKNFKDLLEIPASEGWNTNQEQGPLKENREVETSNPKPPRNLLRHRPSVNNKQHELEKIEISENFSSWDSVVNPTEYWGSKEEKEIKERRPAERTEILPQRIKHSNTHCDSSTNTNYLDFSLSNQSDPIGVKVLLGNPRSITDFVSTLKTEMPETLFLDKSTMTGEESSNHDETIDISQISLLFPHIPKKCILEMVDKCQGNMDWAVDLLLDSEHSVYTQECDESEEEESTSDEEENIIDSNEKQTASMAESPVRCNSQEHDELKKVIESSFFFDKSHYSDQVLKVMQRKNPKYLSMIESNQLGGSKSPIESVRQENELSPIVSESDEESDELSSSTSECDTDNEKEYMELIFSNDLLLQLKQKFGNATLPQATNLTPVVKMPVSLARQLYGYIMDSIQSEMDQQQDIIEEAIMKDEEIAKLLQYDEEKCLEPQLQEIMDMEIALAMHKADQEALHDKSENTVAARLSQNILFEKYPQVDHKVLVDMLKAHNYSLHDTTASLALALDQPAQAGPSSQPLTQSCPVIPKSEEGHEEEQSNDLLEEAQSHRDQAATYYSLRSECLNKAHEAFRSGNKTVATYYSQMAQIHKKKIEVCNSRAAACLLSSHKRGNTLDLHFLHVMEAEVVLDMFLDEIISDIAQQRKNHRTVFIITGRGLRSRGGISRIKPMALRKLQARKLQYNEVNPGMLSVLIQGNSTLSHKN